MGYDGYKTGVLHVPMRGVGVPIEKSPSFSKKDLPRSFYIFVILYFILGIVFLYLSYELFVEA